MIDGKRKEFRVKVVRWQVTPVVSRVLLPKSRSKIALVDSKCVARSRARAFHSVSLTPLFDHISMAHYVLNEIVREFLSARRQYGK